MRQKEITMTNILRTIICSKANIARLQRGLCLLLLLTLVGKLAEQPMSAAAVPHKTTKKQTKKKPKGIDAPKYVQKKKLPVLEGILVERDDRAQTLTGEGSIIEDSNGEFKFNPASTIKLGTALWALVHYGRDYTYKTEMFIDGTIDREEHVLIGDVYIEGNDPTFRKEQGKLMAMSLTQRGIQSVKGNLFVSKSLTMNFYWSGKDAGDQLMQVLSPMVPIKGKNGKTHYVHAGIVFKGRKVGDHPPSAELIDTYESPKLVELLKPMLCFSINPMAENIGKTLGGPKMMEEFLREYLHLDADDIHLDSTSGLGKCRIKTHAMMRILFALDDLLQGKLSAILAVAGQDHGTLFNRFNKDDLGTVMAKTGTLPDTDYGVSALAGQANTGTGRIWLVIFEQQGKVPNFHTRQAGIVKRIQSEQGGSLTFDYTNTQRPLAFEFSPGTYVHLKQIKR
jgi:D-alanyl-D-alanine carboxypeptidase